LRTVVYRHQTFQFVDVAVAVMFAILLVLLIYSVYMQ